MIKSNISILKKQLAATKEASSPMDIRKALDYIKATMSYENLDVPEEVFQIMADNMQGKYTDEQARHMILKRHGLV